MSLPQVLNGADPCAIMARWILDHRLAMALVRMANRLPFELRIISGFRTVEHQQQLLQDRPEVAAQVDRSTHTTCPATGADVWPSIAVTPAIKARIGREGVEAGLRWGGGSRVDSGGIPSDWNHFDLGPRSSSTR